MTIIAGSAGLYKRNDESIILSACEAELPQWQRYYNRLQFKGIYHQPDYIRLLTRYYYKDAEAELFIYSQGDEFVYYPYFKRRIPDYRVDGAEEASGGYSDIISSWYYGGPLVSREVPGLIEGFRRDFESYCCSQGIVSEFIRFDPYLENHRFVCPVNSDVQIQENRDVVYIDLRQTKEVIVKPYKKRYRLLKRALEQGVEISFQDNKKYLEDFCKIYHSEMERKKAPAGYLFDIDFFNDLLNIDSVYFIVLLKQGKCIGGDWVVGQGNRFHDYLRATEPGLWNLRINDLLIHENIFYFKQKGHHVYDLQGGRQGVIEFKQSFSPLRKPFKVARAIHMPDIYRSLMEACPGSDPSFFPAYRPRDKN
jgi:hypothetical protein